MADQFNDDEIDLLQRRIRQRALANNLGESDNPQAPLGLQLAAGGLDLLSKNFQTSQDINAMYTGVKGPNQQRGSAQDMLRQAMANQATRKRQAALDDVSLLGVLQKQADAKKADQRYELEKAENVRRYSQDRADRIAREDTADERARRNDDLQRQLLTAQIAIAKGKAAGGADGGGAKEYKKEQYDAATFAQRMNQAEAVFSSLEAAGYNRASPSEGLQASLPNWAGFAQNNQLRAQNQAEQNFVNAVLRRESGAAISPQEYENAAQQYFPRPGDSVEVLAQKAANRKQTIAGIATSAGGAIKQVPYIAPPSIAGGAGLDDQDVAAVSWAQKNPSDPRAKQILQLHGGL